MKKLFVLFLVIVLFLTSCFSAVAENKDNNIDKYTMTVQSSRDGKKTISVVKQNNIVLMDLNDILSMTNSSRADNGDVIHIKRGSRKITLNKATQKISEEYLDEERNITINTINNAIYVPAYTMLNYLGADCILQDNVVQINMPLYTFWDAYDFDKTKYRMDLNEIWGENLSTCIICDGIMEVIFNTGFIGIFKGNVTNYNYVMEDAMYSTLKVNMFAYDSCVKECNKAGQNTGISNNVSKLITQKWEDNEDSRDTAKKVVDIVSDGMDLYNKWLGDTGRLSQKLSKTERDKILEKSKPLNKLCEEIDKGKKLADFTVLISDIIYSSYEKSNHTIDEISSIESFHKAMKEFYPDSMYFKVADRINSSVQSEVSAIISTTFSTIFDEIVEYSLEKGLKFFLEDTTPGLILKSVNTAINFVSLIPWNAAVIKESASELRAMYLIKLQSLTSQLLSNKGQLMGSNLDTVNLQEYKQLLSFWVRITMAANEKLISSGVRESVSKQNNEELSVILFKLSNCQVKGISWEENDPVFSKAELKESGNFEWIIEPSIEADDIQPIAFSHKRDIEQEFLRSAVYDYGQVCLLTQNNKESVIDYTGKIVITSNDNILVRPDGFQVDCELLYDLSGNLIDNENDIVMDATSLIYSLTDKNFYSVGYGDAHLLDFYEIAKNMGQGIIVSAVESDLFADYEDFKFIYINKDNNLISKDSFEDGYDFYQGTAACKKNGKWGYIDTTGKTVIPFEYDYAYSFGDGIAAVCKDGKWGYIDKENNTVIDFEFEATRPHYKGQAWVKQNGKWGVILLDSMKDKITIPTTDKIITEDITEDSSAEVITEDRNASETLNYYDTTPFQQKYWVIFTEGYRNDRVEVSTIDSSLPPDKLAILWDSALELNDSSGSDGCEQYYLDENGEWVYMRKYHRLTDKATNVIASNLDVVDRSGNIIVAKSPYAMVDWNKVNRYR